MHVPAFKHGETEQGDGGTDEKNKENIIFKVIDELYLKI